MRPPVRLVPVPNLLEAARKRAGHYRLDLTSSRNRCFELSRESDVGMGQESTYEECVNVLQRFCSAERPSGEIGCPLDEATLPAVAKPAVQLPRSAEAPANLRSTGGSILIGDFREDLASHFLKVRTTRKPCWEERSSGPSA